MKQKTLILAAALVMLVLLCAPWVAAQEPDWDYFIFLPMVLRSSTVAPTPTPRPTATFTPTPRPTYTPEPPGMGVHVLPNHSYYTYYDYLLMVGEVQNDTSDYLHFVRVTANVFDSGGRLLDTDYTYTYLWNLPPGERTCFKVWFLDEPAGWSYYTFETSYWTGGESLPSLALLGDSGSYDPVMDWYEILGQVRNDHSAQVKYVSPIGTLYNTAGTVVGCDYTYVSSTDLDPGQTSSFKIWFYGRGYADVVSYRLQVDGDPQ